MNENENMVVRTTQPSRLKPVSNLRIWMTREGVVYMTILLFVTSGAVLRSVNLLIFMAGMMIAPLFLNWRIQRHFLKHLRARRILPNRIHAGLLVNIQWEVQNLSHRISAWNIVIEDQIQQVDRTADPLHPESGSPTPSSQEESTAAGNHPESTGSWLSFYRPVDHQSESAQVAFLQVNSGDSEFRSYRCLFTRRGIYKLGPASVSTIFPFGIIKGSAEISQVAQVIVAPAVGTLSANWEKRMKSVAIGNESVHRQLGMNEEEFYAIRGWRSGDNQRHIHWRSTAKRGEPMVRQFDQLSNRDLGMVLDLFAPSLNDPLEGHEREGYLARCESALSFAATVLVHAHQTVKGKISIGLSGSRTFHVTDRHDITNRALREMALAQAGASNELTELTASVARSLSQGTPIYIVSSRDQPDSMREHFQSQKAAKQLRWLKVGSPEFQSLFQLDHQREQKNLTSLKERWVNHVEG